MGIPLTPPAPYGQIPPISSRLLPRFSVKTFTFFISVVDVMMFVSTLIFAGVKDTVFDPTPENAARAGPRTVMLFLMGGKFTPCIQAGEIFRLFTPIVLHAGIIHLCSNLFFQLHFGFTLEKRWNWKRFAMIYLITGLGASLLSSVTSPVTVSIGASGALFGILGADLAYLIMNWQDIPQNKPEACVLTMVIVMNFLIGVASDGIDNFAHLGGLLTGIFAGAFLCPPVHVWPVTRLYQWIGAFLTIVFFTTLVLLIYLQQSCDNPAQCSCPGMYAAALSDPISTSGMWAMNGFCALLLLTLAALTASSMLGR